MGIRGTAKVLNPIDASGNLCQWLSRMRSATILVVRLRGVATEAIKNMVLAGIGKLIIMDSDTVCGEDLGAGFFFRDEDVGQKVRGIQL